MSVKLRIVVAILAALVTSAVAAFAVSLGGLNTEDLGAGVEVVSSCDTDGVGVWYYGEYDPIVGDAVLVDIHIGNISEDCDGQTMKVAIGDFDGTVAEGEVIIDVNHADWPIVRVPLTGDVTGPEVTDIAITILGEGS